MSTIPKVALPVPDCGMAGCMFRPWSGKPEGGLAMPCTCTPADFHEGVRVLAQARDEDRIERLEAELERWTRRMKLLEKQQRAAIEMLEGRGVLSNPFTMVEEFWRTGHPTKVAEAPSFPDDDMLTLNLDLIAEEFKELRDAVGERDLVEVADALADLVYVTIGMAITHGIPLEEVFAEVHRTNMEKFPGGKVLLNENGKITKPPGWKPPDIAKILNTRLWAHRNGFTLEESSKRCGLCGKEYSVELVGCPTCV